MAVRIIINMTYDGDPMAVAQVVKDLVRSSTGEDAIIRINRADANGSMSKINALRASTYVKRRPNI